MTPAEYEFVKISDGSWRIEDHGVRAFLFAGTDRALLVDSGFGTGNLRGAVEGLTRLPVMLVNTHADSDHIGCNKLFEEAYLHPSEFPYYYDTAPMTAVAKPLWDGDIIELGGRRFEAVLIPGHTPGSIALLDRDNRLLIAGDSVSDAPIFMFGVMRSLHAYICSLKKLLALSGCFDTVYPSHGSARVARGMIGLLLEGAERVLNGEIEGRDPPFDIPAKLYSVGNAAFFCDK